MLLFDFPQLRLSGYFQGIDRLLDFGLSSGEMFIDSGENNFFLPFLEMRFPKLGHREIEEVVVVGRNGEIAFDSFTGFVELGVEGIGVAIGF